MRQARILIALGVLLWVATVAFYFWPASPPYESFGEDTVTPSHVKAGEAITISRNFRATRRELWTVSRTLVQGDCRKSCELIDLPSGSLMVEEGTYVDVRRTHVIPMRVTPGVWVLRFTVQWDTAFWGTQKSTLPPLTITIDPP